VTVGKSPNASQAKGAADGARARRAGAQRGLRRAAQLGGAAGGRPAAGPPRLRARAAAAGRLAAVPRVPGGGRPDRQHHRHRAHPAAGRAGQRLGGAAPGPAPAHRVTIIPPCPSLSRQSARARARCGGASRAQQDPSARQPLCRGPSMPGCRACALLSRARACAPALARMRMARRGCRRCTLRRRKLCKVTIRATQLVTLALPQAGQGRADVPAAPRQVYNVTLGGLAYTDEIFNVSIWFGNGQTRRLGWFPYSLYSFASDRLPTPRGGLLPPTNGANFTLATGWIGRCAAASLPLIVLRVAPHGAGSMGSGAWEGCPSLRGEMRGCLHCKCANMRNLLAGLSQRKCSMRMCAAGLLLLTYFLGRTAHVQQTCSWLSTARCVAVAPVFGPLTARHKRRRSASSANAERRELRRHSATPRLTPRPRRAGGWTRCRASRCATRPMSTACSSCWPATCTSSSALRATRRASCPGTPCWAGARRPARRRPLPRP